MDRRIETAIRDLEKRTLASVPGDVARLVYLSSTRDYNTGRYRHEGLSAHFGEGVADAALAWCHEAAFRAVLYSSLSQLVESLDRYIQASGEPAGRVLEFWQTLQAYQVLVPARCDSISMELFASNIKIALAILEHRAQEQRPAPELEPASPQPL